MKGRIRKVVNYIDNNYHSIVDESIIKELTGVTLGHFRNEFKRISGMSLDKYRIRRQLTLIINEIKLSEKSIKGSNLNPWNDDNSFYVAFKKEFGISPSKYLNSLDIGLQEKFDIDSMIEEDYIINLLKIEHGTYEESLIYLLKLPVYKNKGFNMLFVYEDKEQFYKSLIADYYNELNDKAYDMENIDRKFIKKHLNELMMYYDLDVCIKFSINEEDDKLAFELFNNEYIVVKRNLILKLFKLIDSRKFFNLINVDEIKTIWHLGIIKETKFKEDNTVLIPNELTEQSILTFSQWQLVHEIILMENGVYNWKSFSDLKEHIQYDYSKRIETEGCCDNCNFKEWDLESDDCKFAYDDVCPRYEILTDEEKEYFAEEKFEELSMNTLLQNIVQLLYMGILYL